MSHTTSWNPFYDFCYQTRPYCLLKTIRKGIKISFLVHLGTCITTPNLYTTFMNSCNQQHFKFWSVLFLFLVFKFKILYHNFSLNDEMLVKIVFIPSRYCRSEMWKSSSIIGQSLQSSYKSIIIFKQFQLKFDVLNLLPCCNTLTSIPSIKDKQLFCFCIKNLYSFKRYIPYLGQSSPSKYCL